MGAARQISQEVFALAEQLVAEPFCRQYHLEKQSLAKVSLFIEQRETSLERVAPEQESLKESFRQFKAAYCLFLMQLEQQGPLDAARINTETLMDYLSAETRQGLGVEPHMAGEDDDGPTQIGHLVAASAPKMPPAMPSAEADNEPNEVTQVGNIINYAAGESEPAPMMEPSAEPEAATALQTQAPASEAEPSADEPIVFETQAAQMPAEEVAPQLEEEPQENSGEVKWEVEQVTAAASPIAMEASGPASLSAQEYYSIATYFKEQRSRGGENLPVGHLMRLEAQQICFAIEIEFQEKLGGCMPAFWDKRQETIAQLWDPSSSKGEFNPSLVAVWENATKNSPIWPPAERLPILTLKNSLRFIAASPDAEAPAASILEAGLWVFLFGQDLPLEGGLTLMNQLGMPAFSLEVLSEMFLRLCRVHRIKTYLLNPSNTISEETLKELQSHADALFYFSQSWNAGGAA